MSSTFDIMDQFKLFSLLSHTSVFGFSIITLLLFLSILVWAVIISKWFYLIRLYNLSENFLIQFWESKSLSELNIKVKDIVYSPAREVFRSGFNEMIRVLQSREKKNSNSPIFFETVKRSLSRQKVLEESLLTNRMSVLSICASSGPFIGLLGTVIGIIQAFHDIGVSGASSLATVAPGVSESLIATALGLFVAIPSVVFYNYLNVKIRKHLILLDGFSADFINILERHYSASKPEND